MFGWVAFMISRNMILNHMQGALRNSIAAFIKVSPLLKDAIWNYLEQYDLPVVTAPVGHHTATQVHMFTVSLISYIYCLLSNSFFGPQAN
jgi:hypothetical protein